MYAVMGVTGQVGGAVARTLLAKGEKVRAIVRDREKGEDWRKRGAEISVADSYDAGALEAAFRDVGGVFVMIPPYFAPAPGFPEARAVIAAVRTALGAARPPKAVALSSIGAQHETGVGLITSLHILELELQKVPIPGAFLRAGWFMENSAWDVAPARDQGKLYAFLHPLDRSFPMVATADIGRIAAETLLSHWSGPHFIEIAGPRSYSQDDVAAAFTKLLGRPVEAVAVPREKWAELFVSQGMPADRTAPRIEMLDGFNSGWIQFGVKGTEHQQGVIELEEVLKSLIERQ
jgi:NAD(P)H dehydrogenase (quinone)